MEDCLVKRKTIENKSLPLWNKTISMAKKQIKEKANKN